MKLELTNGGEVLFDVVDYALIKDINWYRWDTKTKSYAFGAQQYMHRLIAGAKSGQVVHHINGNGLDNRRNNLHLGSQRDNLVAIGKQPNNKSGYKGVRHTGRNLCKPWVARYKYCGQTIHIGYFETAEQAAKAYDAAVAGDFGPLAYKNFP